ncbi:MAG: glycosyltransferase [Propionibacteriaceae bacterium]|nr:glycosyltransferase [Propionibacteriaceae bacterium]
MSRSFTIASNQGSVGGGEVMLFAIAEAARELGRDVTVVAPAKPAAVVEEAKRRGFRTVSIDGEGAAGYLRGLRRWDRQHRKGLLWCNGLRPAFATSGHPNRVVELHQRPQGKLKALAKIARRGVLKTIVPSHNMASAIDDVEVLWNWSERVAVERPSRDGEETTVGFIGRWSTDKGILVLCEAMAELERRQPGRFQLLLAGEPLFVEDSDAQAVGQAIDELGSLVDKRGWIEREAFFSEVDLAVFPSVWQESFGLVVTEAMSARVPFVVSDAGALAEVAGPEHPWVAKAGDPQALANVIEAASHDLDCGVEQGWQRWQETFSPAAGTERLAVTLNGLEPAPRTVEPAEPRVALAHDYFTQRGGAERVAVAWLDMFPGAEMTTALYNPDTTYPELARANLNLSFLNKFAFLRKDFRFGLPLFNWAFARTEAGRDADVVLVSTTAFAHAVKTDKPKIVYCHSPGRFLYLVEDYLGGPWWKTPVGWMLMVLRPALIARDKRAARSADLYLCNSTVVKQRIKDVYGIDARVVHPPATLEPSGDREPIELRGEGEGFYLVVSRLMPYKNVDKVIEAFRGLQDKRVLIIGKGPLRDELRANLPPNVTMAEGVSDAQIRWAYANATAVIAPSQEDFGLTPIEGFRFGTPSLALRAGGYLDTVVDGLTGWFFEASTPEEIRGAIDKLESQPLDREDVVAHGEKFTPAAFEHQLRAVIEEVVG